MFCYAELNEENICTGVSDLSGEVKAAHMIPIEVMDEALIGKRYNEGAWEEVVVETEATAEEPQTAEE